MCGVWLHSLGTHWVNRDMMWVPSGQRVLSKAVGMTPSLKGRSAPRPSRASWKARSMYSIDGAISTDPVWCSASSVPGSAVKSGSSERARLILTTPLRVFHRSMSSTKSAGSSVALMWSRKAVWGWRVVTTTGARISSPLSSTTPRTRPLVTMVRATRAPVRISAPRLRADRSMASATAPMPPSGKPQLPRCPSPMSPMEWWAIT